MRTTAIKPRYKVNKVRLYGTLIMLVTIAVLSVMVAYGAVNGAYALDRTGEDINYTVIEVCEGDSLWRIAADFGADGQDLRKSVDNICRINSLDSYVIYPGQEIKIPVL